MVRAWQGLTGGGEASVPSDRHLFCLCKPRRLEPGAQALQMSSPEPSQKPGSARLKRSFDGLAASSRG